MRTSLTRAVAGVTIAAAAVLAAVGTASATTTPAPTTLSISAAQSTINAGQKDVISGQLLSGTTPVSHTPVWLARVDGSNTVLVDAHFTGKLGKVFFTVSPKTTVTYELVFRGNSNFAASTSSQVTVTVNPAKLPTNLSIVAAKTHIKPGGSDTISGQLRQGKTPLAGRVVWLFRVVKGKLVGGNGHLTGKFGRVFFTVKPGSTTHYILVFLGTPKLHATHSGIVTVVVG